MNLREGRVSRRSSPRAKGKGTTRISRRSLKKKGAIFIRAFSARPVKPSERQFNGVAGRSLLRAVLHRIATKVHDDDADPRLARCQREFQRVQPLRPFPLSPSALFLPLYSSPSIFRSASDIGNTCTGSIRLALEGTPNWLPSFRRG